MTNNYENNAMETIENDVTVIDLYPTDESIETETVEENDNSDLLGKAIVGAVGFGVGVIATKAAKPAARFVKKKVAGGFNKVKNWNTDRKTKKKVVEVEETDSKNETNDKK